MLIIVFFLLPKNDLLSVLHNSISTNEVILLLFLLSKVEKMGQRPLIIGFFADEIMDDVLLF